MDILTISNGVMACNRAMTWLRLTPGCKDVPWSFLIATRSDADETRLGGSSMKSESVAQSVISFSVVRLKMMNIEKSEIVNSKIKPKLISF